MPIKGLLVTLDDNLDKASSALTLLVDREEIELGEQNEKYLPLVMETDSELESKGLYRWIEKLEGVYFVDTVFSSVDGPAKETVNLTNETPERET